MSPRVVAPSVFSLSSAVGNHPDLGLGVHLRWSLVPSSGLPRAPFVVWIHTGKKDFARIALDVPTTPLDRAQIVEWGDTPLSMLAIRVQPDTGQRFTARAYDGPGGTGVLLDEASATTPSILYLYGNRIRSIVLSGRGHVVEPPQAITTAAIVDHPGWKPWEMVGLPVDDSWAASGYPTANLLHLARMRTPIEAAVGRLQVYGPRTGWSATNDRGQAMPAWRAPDAAAFVGEIRDGLLPLVREMLERTPQPHLHARYKTQRDVPAPVSIHGDRMTIPEGSHSRATLSPLGIMLAAAAGDPFAALALGFGAFVPGRIIESAFNPSFQVSSVALSHGGNALGGDLGGAFAGMVMVTVDHQLSVDILGSIAAVPVQLADLVFHSSLTPPRAPSSLVAEPLVRGRRARGAAAPAPALDRPHSVGGPYLESIDVHWDRLPFVASEVPRATTFAITHAVGTGRHELLLTPRPSGGHQAFVAARPTQLEDDGLVHFIDRGLAEPGPRENANVTYSVAAQDWFGQWSPWESATHVRKNVDPQIPSLMRVTIVPSNPEHEWTTAPVQAAEVHVELAWNWSDRSPHTIQVEIDLGTTHTVSLVFPTSGRLPTPAEHVQVEEFAEGPPQPDVARYKVRVSGYSLDFTRVTGHAARVRVRATEKFRPEVWSAWGRTLTGEAPSPVPPPSPELPREMIWTSLPDPGGIARAHISFTPQAGMRHVVYTADETALRRELGLETADLRTRPHERLAALRGVSSTPNFRRAFKRVADGVTSSPHEVALPKGSKLIHFYVVLAVSETNVESPFPANMNDLLAVATPRVVVPEMPRVYADESAGGIGVDVTVRGTARSPYRVDLHRTRNRFNSTSLDRMGAPIATTRLDTLAAGWSLVREDETMRVLRFLDTTASADWAPHWYRAVVWCDDQPRIGELAARSESSAPSVAARAATAAPTLTMDATRYEGAGDSPLIVQWSSDLPLLASPLGVAGYNVTGRHEAGATITSRIAADQVRTFIGPLPEPATAPPVFRHHATTPQLARFTCWLPLPAGSTTVTVQAIDPSGRTTTAMVTVP